MGVISHRWPGITPLVLGQLEMRWWAYYVRAAQSYVAALEEQEREMKRG